MSKKAYYAVRNGRKIGVFQSWDECKSSIHGYKGAEYKKFPSKEEAEQFVQGQEVSKIDLDKLSSKDMVAYVDGSYDIESEDFSYGAVIFTKEGYMEHSERISHEKDKEQRNVSGEIYGAVFAMKEAKKKGYKNLYLHFDYMGIKAWALGEWKRNIELTKKYKKFYDSIKEDLNVEFIKVKAHSNDKYNDKADELAKKALGIK